MRQKKVLEFDEFYEKYVAKNVKKEMYSQKYKTSLANARGTDTAENNIEKLNVRTGYYSMRTRIIKNPWVERRPASEATKWLFNHVFEKPSLYKYNKKLMYQGGLFMFDYENPKYKDTSVLPYFDKYPLVLSLGPVVTNEGPRNLGFNLHLLPPKIRIVVIASVFEIYKRLYRYQIFIKQESPVQIRYQQIVSALERYGVKFCVRMYIPNRMTQIVRFPIKEWHKAIFIPSRGYYGIKAAELTNTWKRFCRKNGFAGLENINWKSII